MSKELIIAIQKKDIKKVKTLINQGVDVNFKDKDLTFKDWTPLHHCIFRSGYYSKFTSVAELTLNNREKFEIEDYKELVPIAELLINNGANIEAGDRRGYTPIFSAINFFAFDMLYLLVCNGGDMYTVTNNKEKLKIFDIIFSRYSFEQQMDEDRIENKEKEKDREAIRKGEGESLNRAYARIDAILKNGYDINLGEYTVIENAVFEVGYNRFPYKVLAYLFDKGANPLQLVKRDNKLSDGLLKHLLDRGEKPPELVEWYRPLLERALIHNVPIEALLDMIERIGVNHVFKECLNTTPFLLSIMHGKLEFIKKLVELGANIDVVDSDGKSALSIAEEKNDQEIITYLKSIKSE